MRFIKTLADLRLPNLQGQLSPESGIQMGEEFSLEDTIKERIGFL